MSSHALDMLIDLAREARDTAAKLLANERRGRQEQAAQLDLLERYRQEYSQRLHDLMVEGTDLITLQNYSSFLGSLDAAVQQARDNLQAQETKELQSREHWRQQQVKLSSYDALASRRLIQQRLLEQRAEGRQQDEIANTAFLRKRLAQMPSDQ